jgi:mannose-6-phosphate isomerase-like protein (cupin superfamily)
MFPFNLDTLPSKELFKDVFVEHLVVVLEGEMEFMFEDQKPTLKKWECLFVPAKKRHSARVVQAPVKALEIYNNVEDQYYER